MGNIVRINCCRCDYHNELTLGAGSRQYSPESIKKLFNYNAMLELNKWLKIHTFSYFDIDKVIGYCNKCNRIEAMQKAIFFISDDMKTFYNTCTHCHGRLRQFDFADEELLCPQCKCKLQWAITGFWD